MIHPPMGYKIPDENVWKPSRKGGPILPVFALWSFSFA
jgi:hypothetical protein